MHGPPENETPVPVAQTGNGRKEGHGQADAVGYTKQEVVATVQKNSREKILIRRGSYKGHEFIDVRVFVEGKDGEAIATKKGLALSPDKWPELMTALEKALA